MNRSEAPSGSGDVRSTIDTRRERTRRGFRPRALPTLAAIATVIVCVAAGTWQRERYHAKESLRAEFEAAARAEPVPLARLATDGNWLALRYRPVTATGEFDASRQILIDNKVHAGRAGYDVVTPLRLTDGRAVLVDRGWIAQRESRSELPVIPPPTGVVTVHGRIALPPDYVELGRAEPAGAVWQNLDPARYAGATGLGVLPVVIEATAAPFVDDGLVREWPRPDFGAERHEIYMVQWYAFAALAAALWIWSHRPRAVRRDPDA